MVASHIITRRRFLHSIASASAALVGVPLTAPLSAMTVAQPQSVHLPFENGYRELVAYPQKRPLIVITSRPPQLETPFSVFNEGLITPNDAFFVRYHWAGIPTSIDPATFRLKVGGKVNRPLELSLDDLKQLADQVSLVAVLQCSGNSRGFFEPRVSGGQMANGAMGNALWTGIPLKKVLEKAGVQKGAMQVSFAGLDRSLFPNGPAFVKALSIEHALEREVMLAWAMNGEDLPVLNGYPLRLVVPGYYGTYWIKHVSEITVLDAPFKGFWMDPAYRIPDNACACVPAGEVPGKTIPISKLNVRSFIVNLTDDSTVTAGKENIVRGIAFDQGYGISEVIFSSDGGHSWQAAKLGEDMGRYAFREWSIPFVPTKKGQYQLKVRAINRIGQTQPMTALWNPSGYMRNVVETKNVMAR